MQYPPIYGSQINPPAKLYKRFSPVEDVTIGDEIIRIEGSYYNQWRYQLAWVEADDLQQNDDRPITGLQLHTDRMSIKFYGRWKPSKGAFDEPEAGDVVEINGEYWTIEEGIQRAKKKTLIDFATVYLPIVKQL